MTPNIEVASAAEITPTIERYGLAVWRGLMPSPTIAKLIDCVQRHRNNLPAYYSFQKGVLGAGVVEQPLGNVCPALTTAFRQVLGAEPQFHMDDCAFFISTPQFQPYVWHQDGPYIPPESILAWVALNDCGIVAPSLTFALGHPRGWLFTKADTHLNLDKQSADAIFAETGLPTVDLVLRAGDVVFFDGFSIHRTNRRPEMTGHRIAFKLAAFKVSP